MKISRAGSSDEAEIHAVKSIAFGYLPTEDRIALESTVFDADRAVIAADRGRIVGTVTGAQFELTVPGNVIPVEWITGLAVLPTDRRRGVATGLLRHHLREQAEAGGIALGLWASEGSIYRRFGFGMSTLSCRIEVDTSRNLIKEVDSSSGDLGQIEIVTTEDGYEDLRLIHETHRNTRPGGMGRPPEWWSYRLARPMFQSADGENPMLVGVLRTNEGPQGYVLYRMSVSWPQMTPEGRIRVEELIALSPHAERQLWSFCFNMDLVSVLEALDQPPDTILLWLTSEPRRLRLSVRDGVWLRLLNVESALASRTYARPGRLVFRVRDSLCPWNSATFELVGGPDGASCKETQSDPDLDLDVSALASALLGASHFESMWGAGIVDGDEKSRRLAHDMFSGVRSPWSPYIF